MRRFWHGSSDATPQYVDDEPDSYGNTWDSAKARITRTGSSVP